MVIFYFKRIIQGKKLWTEVPSLWQQDTCDMLKENGYILNEDGTVTKEKE